MDPAVVYTASSSALLSAPTATPAGSAATPATSLIASKIQLVKNVLLRTANLTWERGTHAEALIELDYPVLSVFSPLSMPPPTYPYPTSVDVLAALILAQRPPGILPLALDSSSADPASMGVAILLANWTVVSRTSAAYGDAAYDQVQYLLTKVPRTADGAISHRAEHVQLWSDFVYMVPPFLAYYGALTHNISVMQEAFDQCRLYRNYLRDPSGLWRHIVLGPNGTDAGYWATGNAWAAAGMIRTMSTLLYSSESDKFTDQISLLASWTTEIVEASFAYQRTSDHLFPNYLDQPSTFSDAASTALMTSVSYRLAQLSLGNATIPRAEVTRLAIYSLINATTGILLPVVDPLNFPSEGTMSPEGEAFVLIMEASWRDWLSGGGTSTRETRPPKAIAPSPVSYTGTLTSTMAAIARSTASRTASMKLGFRSLLFFSSFAAALL